MEFKENLRFLRYANNMSQDELADKLGYKSFTTVQKWEDGSAFPRVKTLNMIADIFDVDVDHLLNLNIRNDQVAVPILGEVKAGYNMYADENIMGYEYINNNEYGPGEYFYLRVKGDSMIDLRIGDGDMVFVRKQDYIEDKEIGVFLLDNNEVTVKKVAIDKNGITLKAANQKYPDRRYKPDEIQVLGRVLHNKVTF
ncbi:MAG: helix-turn-helix domain-containing protein [Erysipelotrichaceae bacterium]|nr:helix-turn-helix domain-containing protein [Erysipelotrichaceae bacterium]MBP5279773.1 helix-turn-helix domain-containing protein [Erysipelotrichaceae bacterium]